MATVDEVEETLARLATRFERLDQSYKGLLPNSRTIEAVFSDLDRIYHASWRRGELSDIRSGPADDADIRVSLSSDDLIAMVDGELRFRRAWSSNRLRIEASMTDLIRLRSALP